MFEFNPSVCIELSIVRHANLGVPSMLLLDGDDKARRKVVFTSAKGWYQFSGDQDYATLPFKVDTGSPITVVKSDDWRSRWTPTNPAGRQQFRWLHEQGVASVGGLPGKSYSFSGVGGGSIQVYFAMVTLCFFQTRGAAPPVATIEMIVACEKGGRLKQTLLGLGGDVFQNGGLCLNGRNEIVHLVQV